MVDGYSGFFGQTVGDGGRSFKCFAGEAYMHNIMQNKLRSGGRFDLDNTVILRSTIIHALRRNYEICDDILLIY